MNKTQLRPGWTYTDGKTAVRTVERITTPRPGVDEQPSVIYREVAGRNRGMTHTMPAPPFAQFAATVVLPGEIDSACEALGLHAWPIDDATHGLIVQALANGGIIPATDEHRTRLERMAGHRLATRIGPRRKAERYEVRKDLLDAARSTLGWDDELRLAA